MTTPSTRTLGRDDWMTPAAVFEPLHIYADYSATNWVQLAGLEGFAALLGGTR